MCEDRDGVISRVKNHIKNHSAIIFPTLRVADMTTLTQNFASNDLCRLLVLNEKNENKFGDLK